MTYHESLSRYLPIDVDWQPNYCFKFGPGNTVLLISTGHPNTDCANDSVFSFASVRRSINKE